MRPCKKCKLPRWHENTLIALCRKCYNEKQASKTKKNYEIPKKSKTNKNTPAWFSKKVIEAMNERDSFTCILDSNSWSDHHHIFYWPHYVNYWPSRNDLDQGVLLCNDCHTEIHHGKNGEWQKKRMQCIEYVAKLKRKV